VIEWVNMQVDFAFICDYAEATNKINALGIGFDTIVIAQAPGKHPTFFLVIQMRASVVEAGEKKFEVHLIDEDGKQVIPPVVGNFAIPRPPAGAESTGRIAVRFDNVEFPRFGAYSVHAIFEGHEMVRIPLRVAKAPTPPSPNTGASH
jgi:hypothetical protein